MHFLIDASLPRGVGDVIRARSHAADDVRDIGLGAAPDEVIAAHARSTGQAILTRDGDFGNVVDYPPERYNGIVVIRTPQTAGKLFVLDLVDEFLSAAELIADMSGRLVIVEPGRVRVRPAQD